MSVPPATPPSTTEDHSRWFAEEVKPHEAALRGYLRGAFPMLRDVDDVVQESFLRMLRARALKPIESGKAFLFTVARRLAVDLLRRETVSPVCSAGDVAELPVLEEKPDVAAVITENEKIRLLGAAVGSLPARYRQVIVLHKIQGLSQRETGARLGLTEKAVEHRVAIAMKRCEAFFRTRGVEFF